MVISYRFGSWCLALGLLLGGAQCLALDAQADLEKRICTNLADEARVVLDDSSDTTKYLSPYIAAEIYQQVVAKSLGPKVTDQGEVTAPSMAALTCGDTVSGFLMAIKKRMEYNRFDYFVLRYRFWIVSALLLVAGVVFYVRQRRGLGKQGDGGAAT